MPMSKQELQEFLLAMERLRVANTASPEKARQFLKEEGYLTEDGKVAEPYASVGPVLKP
jgi:hypothetical protein